MPNGERQDYDAIVSLVEPGTRVLDLGCGDGALLARLVAEKNVTARGVEISEDNVRACIARGLSVRHGNIEEGLADYRDNALDYVILSQTLAYLNQPAPVVQEMLRVGRHAVISFENAGYWRARWRAACGDGLGHPLASGEPRQRAITLGQFGEFSAALGARIEKRIFLSSRKVISACPNWRATIAVYLLTK